MPVTPDNIRRVFWDPAPTSPLSPNIWKLRWREQGTTNWNLYPFELNTSEAIFGVNVSGEALSPGYSYIAVLELGKEYEVQVQHKCSGTNFSAWSSSVDFNTYLTCPAFDTSPFTGTSPLAPYWILDEASSAYPTRVRVLWGYNAKGSLVWPKMWLNYRLQGSGSWTTVQYPRDGSQLLLDLPSTGIWEFELLSQCTGTSPLTTTSSGVHTHTVAGQYPAPTAMRVRPTNIGGRFYWVAPVIGSPATTAPIIGYRYRIDGGSWVSIGVTTSLNYTGIAGGGSPAAHTIDLQAEYAGSNFSTSLTLGWDTAPQTDVISLGIPVASSWTPTSINFAALIDNTTMTGTLGPIGSIQSTLSGLTPSSSVYIDSSTVGTNIIGQIVHGNGVTYNPAGNYALPDANVSIPVTGGTVVYEKDTGYLRFTGYVTTNGSGEGTVTIPAVVNWNTRLWANP